MALSQRLEIRQSHALVMTPQLMQAIKLLQLSNLDLMAYVDTEFERNPLLERPVENEVEQKPTREEGEAEETREWGGVEPADAVAVKENGVGTQFEEPPETDAASSRDNIE